MAFDQGRQKHITQCNPDGQQADTGEQFRRAPRTRTTTPMAISTEAINRERDSPTLRAMEAASNETTAKMNKGMAVNNPACVEDKDRSAWISSSKGLSP